jgi:hypothetical protein
MIALLVSIMTSLVFPIFGAVAPSSELCPDPREEAAVTIAHTGAGLYAPQTHEVLAGGTIDLATCSEDLAGFVALPADFAFALSEMADYERLALTVQSTCDTVLLVQSPAGEWFYDDDTNDLNPALDLLDPADGIYRVWVGTYGADLCEAALTLESFFNREK